MRNLIRRDFCLSVIVGLFQYSLESSLSLFSLHVHLEILGVCMATNSKLFILSYFLICFSRNLMGPMFGVSIMEGHSYFLVIVRCGMGVFVWVCGTSMCKSSPFLLIYLLVCCRLC